MEPILVHRSSLEAFRRECPWPVEILVDIRRIRIIDDVSEKGKGGA